MAKIKTNENAYERLIKIQRQALDALFKMHAMRHHLGGPSAIQRPQLHENDSHPSVHQIR